MLQDILFTFSCNIYTFSFVTSNRYIYTQIQDVPEKEMVSLS